MVVVIGKLEDHMQDFLPGSVHKLRYARKNAKKMQKLRNIFLDNF